MINQNPERSKLIHYRYQILFVVMLISILLPGFFPLAIRNALIGPMLNVLLMGACLLVVQKMKRIATYVGAIGMLGVTFNWFEGLAGLIGLLVFSIYLGIVSFELFSDLVRKKSIGICEIFGALDGYMLIGTIGFLLFLAIHLFIPEAYSNVDPGRDGSRELLYFSYITMLTIGYGEIVPLADAARSLAIIVGLIGQFYLVVVIATFVGKFLMHSNSKN